LFAPPPLFEFSEPSLLAPLKAQVGLIYDRYKPKHPADRWLPRTQPWTYEYYEPSLRSAQLRSSRRDERYVFWGFDPRF